MRTNWSGNHVYSAAKVHAPRTVEELQEVVKRSAKLRALGTRHSFNDLADVHGGDQVFLENFRGISVDRERRTVTVGGGVTYAQLSPVLEQSGLALHNLASLPHISVAGAVATGTHGSGTANGGLATAVSALEIVNGQGELVRVSRASEGARFDGMVVALGALGMVTSVTLQAEPSYSVRQDVFEHLPVEQVSDNMSLYDLFAGGYSVSLFTHWQGREIAQVWVKSRLAKGDALGQDRAEYLGALAATEERHPLPGHGAQNCTPQMGVPGPWYERLPHFRSDFTPSSGNELQTEFFVPLDRGAEAIAAVAMLEEKISPLLFVSELRTVAADRLWLSPCYERESLGIHFTWKPEWDAVRRVLPEIEAALEPFAVRPHWAKLFTMDSQQVRLQYAQMEAFVELAREFDPEGKFRNGFLDRYVFVAG